MSAFGTLPMSAFGGTAYKALGLCSRHRTNCATSLDFIGISRTSDPAKHRQLTTAVTLAVTTISPFATPTSSMSLRWR
jgi:hypothetical protein